MKNIKKIHCLGTSFSAGGGFEFDSPQQDTKILKSLYKQTNEKLIPKNFSWPGQLEKLLPKNIKVLNHAKSGFGNERMYRISDKLISDKNFNKDENLFIFESSWIGRKEYFLNSIEDYVIYNYTFKEGDEDLTGVGYNYLYDNKETQKKLDKFKKILLPFFNETFNETEVEKEIFRNARFFLSFLKQKKINFLFINSFLPEIEEKNKVTFKLENKIYKELGDLVHSNKYSIENETSGKIGDKHLGYFGNKLIAMNVFNNLIENGFISDTKLDLNSIKYTKYNRNLL